MKKISLLPVVILLLSGKPDHTPELLSTEAQWNTIFSERLSILEQCTGITFTDGWVPTMQFGAPDYISNSANFGGCYDQTQRSFWVTNAYRSMPATNELPEAVRLLVDHELGHALADQISCRKNGYTWPDTVAWKNQTDAQNLSDKILSEGVGEYFGRLLSSDTSTSAEWLPEDSGGLVWLTHSWPYYGGYWLVKPIIDQFGEKGIIYITQHKFSFEDSQIRQAGYLYQTQAIEKLSGY